MSAVSLKAGSALRFEGKDWRIRKPTGTSTIWIEEVKTREGREVDIAAVLDQENAEEKPARAIHSIHSEDLAEARRRLAIIRPILECTDGRMRLTATIAEQQGVGESTLRRWIHAYLDRGLLSDLAPARKGRAMPARLDERREKLLAQVIEETYLTTQRHSVRKTYAELSRRAKLLRLTPPHISTLRARIAALPEQLKVLRRLGRKAARDRFAEVKGHFPDAEFPLATVQIDHTLLDIFIVDDEDREPIGRVWLTLAIDVFSRMVVGYYLSLDPPSAFSVGMCIAQAANQKDAVLKRVKVDGDWPVWGLPRVLHADNGKDFRSRTIRLACEQYGINMAWRPVKQPHFGGHIERLLGTVATEIKALPGTTFSNVKELGEYDSAKHAVMSFDELERWLVQFFVNVYHQRKHSGIGMPPLQRWRMGILGDGRKLKGTGLPDPILNPVRFARDLLPYEERCVGRDGIVWDKICYFHDSLRPWLDARKAGTRCKFIVRRDPRDISKIYFLDPELKEYLEIPYRDLSKPSISIWEYRQAEKYLETQGKTAATEDEIFAAYEVMSQIADKAKVTTKKARRARQRKRNQINALAAESGRPEATTPTPSADQSLRLVVDNTADQVFDIPDFLDGPEEI